LRFKVKGSGQKFKNLWLFTEQNNNTNCAELRLIKARHRGNMYTQQSRTGYCETAAGAE